MSQFNLSGTKGYVANGAIGNNVAVKLSSGKIVAATAGTDLTIGVTESKAADGEVASVRLRSAQGTIKAIAGGTIAVNDAVTATTAGKVITTTTAGNQILGYALEAAASGDLVELMPTVAKY